MHTAVWLLAVAAAGALVVGDVDDAASRWTSATHVLRAEAEATSAHMVVLRAAAEVVVLGNALAFKFPVAVARPFWPPPPAPDRMPAMLREFGGVVVDAVALGLDVSESMGDALMCVGLTHGLKSTSVYAHDACARLQVPSPSSPSV